MPQPQNKNQRAVYEIGAFVRAAAEQRLHDFRDEIIGRNAAEHTQCRKNHACDKFSFAFARLTEQPAE